MSCLSQRLLILIHTNAQFLFWLITFSLSKPKTYRPCIKTPKNTSKLYPLAWSPSDSCIPSLFRQPLQALLSSPSFPQSVFSISLLCLFCLPASRLHPEVCFDHSEVWRKEPPSSQISYGARLQTWHVYQAECTTHPFQLQARRNGKRIRGRRGRRGWERLFSDSLLKTWNTSCTSIFPSHTLLLTYFHTYLLTHSLTPLLPYSLLLTWVSCVDWSSKN